MKTVNIRVIPNAKKQKIVEAEGLLKVYVNAPATEGRANEAVIELLAEHFGTKKRLITIISGLRSRQKTIQIPG